MVLTSVGSITSIGDYVIRTAIKLAASACDWLDSIFAVSYTAEYLSGGTGQDTSHRRLVFYQSLHASLVRGCADMVEHLTPTSANLATAAAVDAAAAATTTHQPPTTPAP